jgi:asparagine synthase (glutamine-hydrolysing)
MGRMGKFFIPRKRIERLKINALPKQCITAYNERLFEMGAIIAIINKRGENATETALAMLKMLKYKSTEAFGIAAPTALKIEKSIEALQKKDVNSPVIIGHTFSKILTTDKPQPLRLEDAALVFEGRIYPTVAEISDAEVVAKQLQKNREGAIKNLIEQTEGNFTFALAEQRRLIVGRDAMGIYPLYYGENADLAALASERKALWSVGIKTVNSLPPGHMAFVDEHGLKLKPIKTLAYSEPKKTTMQVASKKLEKLLQHSTKERVSGLKKVAVAFSGGLDSSIIAHLAKNSGVDVHLIYVSLENQSEIDHAEQAAEELKLPIHVYLYDEEDVKQILPKILWLIEEPDPVKASIGTPIYWVAENAAEMKFRVMLAGQGADELFGGYKRYVDDYTRYGSEKAQETILNDILKMYETNFERDFKICNFHNVELRLPFATGQIAKFAIDLPVEFKIVPTDYGLRKLVLRRVAENLGLPQFIVKKPKRAIQYTTGINKTLKKLARQEGFAIKEYVQKTFQAFAKKMVKDE